MSQSTSTTAVSSDSSAQAPVANRPKAFDVLNPYNQRVLFANRLEDIEEFIHALRGDETVAIQDETFGEEDGPVYKYVDFPKGRVYMFIIDHPGVAHAVVKKIFPLTAQLGSSSIVYIHPSAIAMIVKLTTLQNFPTILFRNSDELASYVTGGIVFDDKQELIYSLLQKQRYLETSILPREEFSKNKADKIEAAKERRGARRAASPKRGPPREKKEPRRQYQPRSDSDEEIEPRKPVQRREPATVTRKVQPRSNTKAPSKTSWSMGDDEDMYIPQQDDEDRPQRGWNKNQGGGKKKSQSKANQPDFSSMFTPEQVAALQAMAAIMNPSK